MVTIENAHILYHLCTQEKSKVDGYGFTAGDYYMMKEALLMTLEEVMNTELSNQTKTAIVKICKLVRNFITK